MNQIKQDPQETSTSQLKTYCQKCLYFPNEEHICDKYYLLPKEIQTIEFHVCGLTKAEIFMSIYLEIGKVHKRGVALETGKYRMCLCCIDINQKAKIKIQVLTEQKETVLIDDVTLVFFLRPKYVLPTLVELSATYNRRKQQDVSVPEHLLDLIKVEDIHTMILSDLKERYGEFICTCGCKESTSKIMEDLWLPIEMFKELGARSDEEYSDNESY